MSEMTKQYETLEEVKSYLISIKNKKLWIHKKTDHIDFSKFGGDATSFGYDEDEGEVFEATYEQAVGVLADDAVAYIAEREEVIKIEKAARWRFSDYFITSKTANSDEINKNGYTIIAKEINSHEELVKSSGKYYSHSRAYSDNIDTNYDECFVEAAFADDDDSYETIQDAIDCIVAEDKTFKECFAKAKQLQANFQENLELIKNA